MPAGGLISSSAASRLVASPCIAPAVVICLDRGSSVEGNRSRLFFDRTMVKPAESVRDVRSDLSPRERRPPGR